MQSNPKIPITILCGFLGSGKTTLLRRWQVQPSLREAAFIIHDLSDFGVDIELLTEDKSLPKQGRMVDRMAALHGVHARENLHNSAAQILDEIAQLSPPAPHVLCESTGAARPWPLITALTQNKGFYLRHFIVTVDALNLYRDFDNGRVLTGETPSSEDPALSYAAEILAEQLLFASVIILTKIDTITKIVMEKQVAILKKLQPYATIALCAHAGIQLSQLEVTPAPQFLEYKKRAEHFRLSINLPTAPQVEAFVLEDARPFHPQRLYEVCQTQLGTGIYRTKGFIWLASRSSDVLLWQQSGSQISFELTSVWAAEAVHNRYGKLLASEVEDIKSRVDSVHPVFGDRQNKLTIIGLPQSCKVFLRALRGAPCTEREIRHWQEGGRFNDPWPKNLRSM